MLWYWKINELKNLVRYLNYIIRFERNGNKNSLIKYKILIFITGYKIFYSCVARDDDYHNYLVVLRFIGLNFILLAFIADTISCDLESVHTGRDFLIVRDRWGGGCWSAKSFSCTCFSHYFQLQIAYFDFFFFFIHFSKRVFSNILKILSNLLFFGILLWKNMKYSLKDNKCLINVSISI